MSCLSNLINSFVNAENIGVLTVAALYLLVFVYHILPMSHDSPFLNFTFWFILDMCLGLSASLFSPLPSFLEEPKGLEFGFLPLENTCWLPLNLAESAKWCDFLESAVPSLFCRILVLYFVVFIF